MKDIDVLKMKKARLDVEIKSVESKLFMLKEERDRVLTRINFMIDSSNNKTDKVKIVYTE